jgi:hypothetical protein
LTKTISANPLFGIRARFSAPIAPNNSWKSKDCNKLGRQEILIWISCFCLLH